METQKFMGRGQLIDRLTAQIGSREGAIAVLRQRGQMHPDSEKLTPAGEARNNMTAAERAKDRAAKAANKSPAQFIYNPKTNTATLKRR
jgi:hypothetical protein